MNSAEAAPLRMRAAIVDDEPTARRGLRRLLEAQGNVDVVGEAGNVGDAVQLIERERPDLLLLDVQMPQGTGFDVLQRVAGCVPPAIVFITAYDHYALRAFEVNAVDYLLKPFDDARFAAAIARARAGLQLRQHPGLNAEVASLLRYLERKPVGPYSEPADDPLGDRLAVKSSGEIVLLKIDEIDWVEAEGDYLILHAAGKSLMVRETMQRMEARLDARRFVRIHRSTIVNLDRIKKLSPTFVGEYNVVLHDGTKLKLSRGYHGRLQDKLKHAL